MKKIIIGLSVLLGSMQLLVAQTSEEKDQIIKQIQEKDRKLETFIKQGKTDSIAALFSPNCHLAGEYGDLIESREKVKEYYSKEKSSGKKISSYSLTAEEHKVYDDVVLEIGTNTVKYTIGADKKLYITEYNYMLVWKQSKNGPYQIRAAMWNLKKNPCAQ